MWPFRKKKPSQTPEPTLVEMLLAGEKERASLNFELEKARMQTELKRKEIEMQNLDAVREQDRLDAEHREQMRQMRREQAAHMRQRRKAKREQAPGQLALPTGCRLCVNPFAPNLSIAEITAHRAHGAAMAPQSNGNGDGSADG